MLKVGLTGGIGSGKSAVASIFNTIGIPVYMADTRAHALLSSNPLLRDEVIALFGPDSFGAGGSPDRAYIADKVFHDAALLEKLNNIVHPAVRQDFAEWCERYHHLPYVIQEAAVLLESGGSSMMDENILVWAPEELRITRVVDRDKTTRDKVTARMRHQWSDDKKVKLAQFVIVNDNHHSLIRQVLDINGALRYIHARS